MKKLMALITVATLALSSSTLVFAEETTTPDAATVPVEAPVAEAEVPAVPVEAVAPEVVSLPLKTTEKMFLTEKGEIVGKYLAFTDNADLSAKVENLIYDTYRNMITNEGLVYANVSASIPSNATLFSYAVVEELPTAAKIEFTRYRYDSKTKEFVDVVYCTVYLDKATSKEMVAEAYAELVPAEVPVVEETTAPELVAPTPEALPIEGIAVALRQNCEALGYVVGWENGSVTITKDDKIATLAAGVNSYVGFDGVAVVLESAPENVEGTLYVPATFFAKVLGLEVVVNADGVATITAPVSAEVPAVTEAPVADVEVPATTEAPVAEVPAATEAPIIG